MADEHNHSAQGQPVDRLKEEFRNLLGAFGERAVGSLLQRVEGSAGRLKEYADNGGGPGLTAALTGAGKLAEGASPARAMLSSGTSAAKEAVGGLLKRGNGKGGEKSWQKATNIVESLDVGAPIRLVYNQWTQFEDFPSFMKKVEKAEQGESDEKVNWKAQILWSHRDWEATIQEQIPDKRISWTSQGSKGHVDGIVTFHSLDAELTRILLVMVYYPQGFFEHTANLWRAQGRRARLELKHFRRHVMKNLLQHPDEVEGWRGIIEDGEVVKDHETAVKEEQARDRQRAGADRDRGEPEDEYEDHRLDRAPGDEYDTEDEYDGDEYEERQPEAEYEDEGDEYEEREPRQEYEDEFEYENERVARSARSARSAGEPRAPRPRIGAKR